MFSTDPDESFAATDSILDYLDEQDEQGGFIKSYAPYRQPRLDPKRLKDKPDYSAARQAKREQSAD
jgi:hypothetical protein